MAKSFTEIPVFVKGEPGFAEKLNQLGSVLGEVIEAFTALADAAEAAKQATAPKATARKAATSK